MIEFRSSKEPTIGVELELQIVSKRDRSLLNIAPDVLQRIDPSYSGKIKEEFIMSMIEVNTGVCESVSEVERDLLQTLQYLEEILGEFDAQFYSASLHPFARGDQQKVSPNPRYKRLMEDLQIVGRRFIAQGLHIHIGVEDAEKAIRVNNSIRVYLPLLLALSTSSPFYEGEYTGLVSYRTKLFEALPRSGMPDYIENWYEFNTMVRLLKAAGYIESVRDLWWDVRPHPFFGTVEIRVCDIPTRFSDIVALTALVQALVVYLSSLPGEPKTQMQILRANKWQAARYGLDGLFANPFREGVYRIREAIEDMLELLQAEADRLGTVQYLQKNRRILREGTGAHRQIDLYRKGLPFEEIIRTIQQEFYL